MNKIKGVIVLNNAMKKIIGVFMCLMMLVSAVLPAFAALDYPEGVDQQTAYESVGKTDVLVKSAVKTMQEKTLKQLAYEMLYADDTLNSLLIGIYSAMNEQTSSLSNLGIDVSTKNVAACISFQYPQVAEKLSLAADWQSVDLTGAKWGVSDEYSFAGAVSAMLSPFDDVLYMLLCSGTYTSGLIGIKGGDGYNNSVVDILKALGCTDILDSEQFVLQAQSDRHSMVKNIVLSLFSMIDAVLDAPATKLCDMMPNLAYYIKYGGLEKSLSALTDPISVGLGRYLTLFKGESMLKILSFFQDTEQFTADFSDNITQTLNDALSTSGITLAEIDLEKLAACGVLEGESVKSNYGEAYTVIFMWLIDTVKLNKDKLSELLSGENDIGQFGGIFDQLLSKGTDELFALIVELLTKTEGTPTPYQWQIPEFSKTQVSYTENLGQEKYQRVLDGIDALLDEFIAESGEEKNLKSLLKKKIYSPELISQLTVGIYSAISEGEFADAFKLLEIPTAPAALAIMLKESQFSSVKAVLATSKSWKNIKPENLNWGFKAGNKAGFTKALVAVLRPFAPVLRALLACDSIEVFDSINICGSDGYNTAVIPLLEALGCESKDIYSYSDYKVRCGGDGAVENLAKPILALIDRIIEKPIYTVTQILPNIVFFAKSGLLVQCLMNLANPLLSYLDRLSISTDTLGFDIEKIKTVDLLGELSEKIPTLIEDIKLEKPDLSVLSGIGELTTYTSKASNNGQNVTLGYVKADQTAVLITVLRYFVRLLQNPDNSSILDSFMGGSGEDGGNQMFAQYSSGIGEQLTTMSTDETIEWLYKLFFRERAVKNEADEYIPTVIYRERTHSLSVKTVIVIALVFIIIASFVLINRKRITIYIENKRLRKSPQASAASGKEE